MRTLEWLCNSNVCDKFLPSGPGALRFQLPEEQGMNPRPQYCCEDCALHIRKMFYTAGELMRNDVERRVM